MLVVGCCSLYELLLVGCNKKRSEMHVCIFGIVLTNTEYENNNEKNVCVCICVGVCVCVFYYIPTS